MAGRHLPYWDGDLFEKYLVYRVYENVQQNLFQFPPVAVHEVHLLIDLAYFNFDLALPDFVLDYKYYIGEERLQVNLLYVDINLAGPCVIHVNTVKLKEKGKHYADVVHHIVEAEEEYARGIQQELQVLL